ncbi:MAG: hypothetical protein O4861_08830 [Trichodesmium sp. St16_bin4-tuft]|nr:hypothetical protein [Trichodesmium sp. MAG_R01]MDE5073552.1 hypothetical protein [Trichodesmium sp. St5_bin8]MDE5090955.1 hypothetical protein [Trichodesmium sp. St18_bin3_1_1]MDE5092759.1 hypothetical protein [Trichodesmium sp. St11_bin5]MDE5098431.1 hypothetical protein [Trichodesmium sp. St16_bin4-tuft]
MRIRVSNVLDLQELPIEAKFFLLVTSFAITKLAAKLVAKAETSWVLILGGVVSGGINWWLIDGLLEVAENYHRYNY